MLQTIYTGKRVYETMLIQSVATQTSREAEYALIAEIRLQQVIVTRTLASRCRRPRCTPVSR